MIWTLLQALVAFLLGTILFDIVHVCLHQCLKSKFNWCNRIGRIHLAHHHFFSHHLHIDKTWQRANLLQHVTMEYTTQLLGTTLCLFFLPTAAVLLALAFETLIFILVIYQGGKDFHHQARTYLKPHSGWPWVGPYYHALHHLSAKQYFSSYIKIVDYLLGSALSLNGKHIVMTGASGALGSNMKQLLEREGAIVTTFKYKVDYDYDHYDKLIPALKTADIVLLCHGTKYENTMEANYLSFVRIIELYKKVRVGPLILPEVWGVGSEIECHPCFGIKKLYPYAQSKRQYAKHARRYFYDENIQYRHLVHAAFTSQMGPGLMSARFAAWLTLFLLKRGFKYIPVTYTGFAYINYFRFLFAKPILIKYLH